MLQNIIQHTRAALVAHNVMRSTEIEILILSDGPLPTMNAVHLRDEFKNEPRVAVVEMLNTGDPMPEHIVRGSTRSAFINGASRALTTEERASIHRSLTTVALGLGRDEKELMYE
ncbi:hypothetical protein P0E55_14155, partial [Enterococcus faecalis]